MVAFRPLRRTRFGCGTLSPAQRMSSQVRGSDANPSRMAGAAHDGLAGLARHLDLGAVPHGFRSSFRDWAAERTDAPREVCEIALAHVNTDRVEAAYRRTDLFERRRALMGDWADYVASGGSGG